VGNYAGVRGHIEDVTAQNLEERKEARPAIQRRAIFIFAPLGDRPEL
jgi:hypothetical protein